MFLLNESWKTDTSLKNPIGETCCVFWAEWYVFTCTSHLSVIKTLLLQIGSQICAWSMRFCSLRANQVLENCRCIFSQILALPSNTIFWSWAGVTCSVSMVFFETSRHCSKGLNVIMVAFFSQGCSNPLCRTGIWWFSPVISFLFCCSKPWIYLFRPTLFSPSRQNASLKRKGSHSQSWWHKAGLNYEASCKLTFSGWCGHSHTCHASAWTWGWAGLGCAPPPPRQCCALGECDPHLGTKVMAFLPVLRWSWYLVTFSCYFSSILLSPGAVSMMQTLYLIFSYNCDITGVMLQVSLCCS